MPCPPPLWIYMPLALLCHPSHPLMTVQPCLHELWGMGDHQLLANNRWNISKLSRGIKWTRRTQVPFWQGWNRAIMLCLSPSPHSFMALSLGWKILALGCHGTVCTPYSMAYLLVVPRCARVVVQCHCRPSAYNHPSVSWSLLFHPLLHRGHPDPQGDHEPIVLL